MTSRIIVIPIVIIVAAFCIALPIIIGTYVYRDAKQRGMNPALWTLLAVLAPGFIGFIIYLIARNENSSLHCPSCGKNVRYNFSVCPYCGTSLKAKCDRCSFVLEPGWETCPNCAEPIPPEKQVSPIQTQKSDKSLRSVLAIVILIPIILCVLLILGTAIFTINPMISTESHLLKKESVSTEIRNWTNDCDRQGEGVYVLKYLNTKENEAQMICYCNFPADLLSESGGGSSGFPWGKDDINLSIDKNTDEDDELSDYLLYYTDMTTSRDFDLKITDSDNNELAYALTDAKTIGLTDGIEIDTETIDLEISIAENVKSVYEISWTLWSGDEPFSTDAVMNADYYYMDKLVSLSSSYLEENNIDSFSFELLGKNHKTIFESKKYKLDPGEDYELFGFNVGYNQNGKLDVINEYY
ncbi:MAG: zinc ribbon domain-containing protein [Faecalibacterium sp.]|nr:zinc ribbon domain-containing protein [Ruminococcus sp.]MCM1392556.1 zinc ribbon domain-containing protein [Ruminococcus sp.]MCM1486241.1 zinc ribbon domain-containing protein [Faecalibacterium sp.]